MTGRCELGRTQSVSVREAIADEVSTRAARRPSALPRFPESFFPAVSRAHHLETLRGRFAASRSRCSGSRSCWDGSRWGSLRRFCPSRIPSTRNSRTSCRGPSGDHPLGTDDLGRDMISRIIWGARVSVPAGILVIALSGTFGCLVGAIAGYTGGVVDNVIMRAADAILVVPLDHPGDGDHRGARRTRTQQRPAWPSASCFGRNTRGSCAGKSWRFEPTNSSPPPNRSGQIEDGSCSGISCRRPTRRSSSRQRSTSGAAIVLTAGLSFIGLGAVPPTPEWGAMIKQGADKGLQYWWYAAAPGMAIMSVVMGLNFFGDGLRDALDPRHRGR